MVQGWSTVMEVAVGGAEQGAQERGGWRLTWMVTRTEENETGRRERVRGIELEREGIERRNEGERRTGFVG